jgi:flagellar protein FlgJ
MKADTSMAQHLMQQQLLRQSPAQTAINAPTKMTDEAARAAAVQFEALLVQTMLKSMRDASAGNSLFSSEQESMYTDMFDQQIAMDIAGSKSLGLAESIYRQIAPANRESTPNQGESVLSMPVRGKLSVGEPNRASISDAQDSSYSNEREFIAAIRPAASDAASALGTSAEAVMAVAALESGWGKRMPLKPDGSQSNNLFGIKADTAWRGDVTAAATTEFANGEYTTTRADFRSYSSTAESIADFGHFIRSNPRYQKALDHAANPEQFIREIHDAGYATDPQYADKLVDIMHSIKAMHRTEQF